MNFITPVEIKKPHFTISHQDRVFSMGSCFAQNMGLKLKESAFCTYVQPMGTLFNPISIFKNLQSITELNYDFSDSNFCENQGVFHHFDYASQLYGENRDSLKQNIIHTTKSAHEMLEAAHIIIITLGTAWVYQNKTNQKYVASCHKVPQSQFEKRLLTLEEIVEPTLKCIEQFPNKKVIFTLSPVRHIKDGLVENFKSKSLLHNALMAVVQQYENTYYFPAFEIMLDELRDYRFYNKDLIHPNNMAVDYIYEKFSAAFFEQATHQIIDEFQKLLSMIHHKPMHSIEHLRQDWELKKKEKIDEFLEKYPHLHFAFEQIKL